MVIRLSMKGEKIFCFYDGILSNFLWCLAKAFISYFFPGNQTAKGIFFRRNDAQENSRCLDFFDIIPCNNLYFLVICVSSLLRNILNMLNSSGSRMSIPADSCRQNILTICFSTLDYNTFDVITFQCFHSQQVANWNMASSWKDLNLFHELFFLADFQTFPEHFWIFPAAKIEEKW